MSGGKDIPFNWSYTFLPEIIELNPKIDKSSYLDDDNVSFVPMPAVEPETGRIDVSETRLFGQVKKGYTPFKEGDVLFAKITPCMENGKMAIAPKLNNGVGFGSTEFHVLRAYEGVEPRFIYFYVSSKTFRLNAEHNMTGAVGQKRVTKPYLEKCSIPLPPFKEQKRIVAKIEELFSELDKGIESLKLAQEQLKVYRQAILKQAFEGKLTAKWREENGDKLESADALLGRIKKEREEHYQQKLDDWSKDKTLSKPQKHGDLKAITSSELTSLPEIPDGWLYIRLAEIAKIGSGMSVSKSRKLKDPIEVPYLRVANVQRGQLILDQIKQMTIEKNKLQDLVLEDLDILFNEGGDRDKLGRGWIWESQIKPCITQNHVFRASAVLKLDFHAKYISHWGNTFGQKYFDKQGKQTTNLASINKGVLSHFPVPLQSLTEQEKIMEILEEKLSSIDHIELDLVDQIQKSEALRQSILKKAFSGLLVPQDATDEPASLLLKRIRAEKEATQSSAKKTKLKKKENV